MGVTADLQVTSAGIRRAHSSFRGEGLPQSTRLRVRRSATVLVLLAMLAGGALASAGAAEAGDLIVLGPDTATISGPLAYDHVYIGSGATLQLAGDTSISAADVYIAGGANLRTCFVPPASNT